MKTEGPQDEEELYEVEGIVDMRTMKNGKVQYKVRWANYSPSNDTWEPVENLESCADFIESFLASKKVVLNESPSPQRKIVSIQKRSVSPQKPVTVTPSCTTLSEVQSCSTSNGFDLLSTPSPDILKDSPSSEGSKRRRNRASEVSKLMQCSIFNVIDKQDLNVTPENGIYQRVKRKRTEYLDESVLSSSASDTDKNGKDDKSIEDEPHENGNKKCIIEDLPLSNIFEMTGSSFPDNTQNDQSNEQSMSEASKSSPENIDSRTYDVDNSRKQDDSIDRELHQLDNLLKTVSVLSSKKRNSKSSPTSVNVDLIDLVIDSVIKKVLHDDLDTDEAVHSEASISSNANDIAVNMPHLEINVSKTIIIPPTDAEVANVKQEASERLTVLQTSSVSHGQAESIKQVRKLIFDMISSKQLVSTEPDMTSLIDQLASVSAHADVLSDSRVSIESHVALAGNEQDDNNHSEDRVENTPAVDLNTTVDPENSVIVRGTSNQASASPMITPIVNSNGTEVADVEMMVISEPADQTSPSIDVLQKQQRYTPPPTKSPQKQQQQTPPRILKPLFSGLWLPLTKAKDQNAVAPNIDEQPPAETKILSLERINDENDKESSESPRLPSIPDEQVPTSSSATAPSIVSNNVSVASPSSSKKTTSLEDMFDKKLNLNDYFKSLMHKNQNSDRTKTHVVTQTDLFESCRLGHFDLVRSALLAARNAKKTPSAYNLNALDEYGRTILMNLVLTKCDSCHIIDDIMELLVQNGANLNLRSKEGDTALMMAIQSEYLCKVTKLLSLGAAANLPNHAGETPLLMACSKGLNLFVTKLLESGADFNAVGASGAPLSALIFNKSITKLIQTHEKRVKSAFDQTLQSILDLDKLRIYLPIFPLHCYSLNESRIFRIIFPHQKFPAMIRANRDHDILVIGLSKFGTQSICVRLWGLSPVVNVLLNGQEQKCVQDDWRFIYKLHCLQNGVNELTIKCADDYRMSNCKLLIQAFVLQRR